MITLGVFFGICSLLTWFAFKQRVLLWRTAAIISWLGLGIMAWTSPFDIGVDVLPTGTQHVLSLICAVMIFATATMQMTTDIRHEQSIRGNKGFPGAESSSWTEWGPPPKKQTLSRSQIAYNEHKEKLKGVGERAERIRANRARRNYLS